MTTPAGNLPSFLAFVAGSTFETNAYQFNPKEEGSHTEHEKGTLCDNGEIRADGFIEKLSVWETTNSKGITLSYFSDGHSYGIEVTKEVGGLAVYISPESIKDRIKLGLVKEEILNVLKNKGYKVRRFVIGGKANE